MIRYRTSMLKIPGKMTLSDLKNHAHTVATFFQIQWQKWKPEIDKLIRAIIAILAVASTFKFALQTIPIVVSMLTIVATLPLVSYLFPSFFFTTSLNSTLIFSVIGVISTFVGYSKYKELILRNDLDTQIRENKQQITNLAKKIQEIEVLQERIANLEKIVYAPSLPLPEQQISLSLSSITPKNDCSNFQTSIITSTCESGHKKPTLS